MAKTKRRKAVPKETDSQFALKLILFMMAGTIWLWVIPSSGQYEIPIPIGALIGLVIARHERFQIDRKIEYAVLLVAMLIGFWAQIGFNLAL